MKTKFYIGTLLAIAIHVMVKSQTPSNQVFEKDEKFVLGYSYYTALEKKDFSKIQDPNELLIKSEKLMALAKKIKTEAKSKTGAEQEMMLDEAKTLENEAEICKIAAAEIKASYNKDEFMAFKNYFISYLDTCDASYNTAYEAKQIYFTAVRCFRIAKEMREEAYAQPVKLAIIGGLLNAEEKEMVAIIKMNEAIKTLKRGVTLMIVKR